MSAHKPKPLHITATFESWWEAKFKIDVQKALVPCRQSLEFFGDPIERADDSDIEVINAFLKLWLPTIIEASIRSNTEEVIHYFAKLEGVFPLNGSRGVTLLHCDHWLFDASDFTIETEVQSTKPATTEAHS